MSPPNSLSASGLAAAASGTSTASRMIPASTAPRRTTGAIPSPVTARAATCLMSSCSIGKNRPRPRQNTITQSTDRAASPGLLSSWPATARCTYEATPSTPSPIPTGSVPDGSRASALVASFIGG